MPETVRVMMWMSDAQKLCTYFNRDWLEFTGQTLEHELGNGWAEGVHPDDLPACLATYNESFDARVDFKMEYRLRHHSGEYRWIIDAAAPRYSSQGEFNGYVGSCIDVSEHRQGEGDCDYRDQLAAIVAERTAELYESEARYRRIVETTEEGIWTMGADDLIDYVNPRACEMLGYSAAELIGRSPLEFLFPEDVERGKRRLARRRQGIREVVDSRFRRKDGTELWLERAASPILDNLGNYRGALSIVTDITKRKIAERALRESEARLHRITDAVPGAVFQYWLSLDDVQAFTFISRGAEELCGYTAEQIRESFSLAWSLVLPEEAEALARSVERAMYALLPWSHEFRIRARDGAVKWLRGTSSPEARAGGGVIANGLFVEITERKRLEEQLLHAETLKSLGVLAGGLAHDFNNLLQSVLSNVELARAQLAPRSPVAGNLEQIEMAARRAADLTNQMLAFAGKGKSVVEPVDLSHLVLEIVQLLEASISKKARLEGAFTPDLPAVEGDATQLRQVLMNLVTNASEALGDNAGAIRVSTGVIQVSTTPPLCQGGACQVNLPHPELVPGSHVFVEVGDTGCGMNEETLAHIFDPFFTTKFAGRGLGLAAVLGIVHSHRGAIQVRSRVGEGTTFRVLFPASTRTAPTVAKPQAMEDEWRGCGTILAVDDEPLIRHVNQAVLERLGFTVLSASNGREALEVYRNHAAEINAVLLDLTMPVMDGAETFRELRRLRIDLPILLASGYTEEEATSQFAGAGLSGFLQKPYLAAQLVEKIRAVLPSET